MLIPTLTTIAKHDNLTLSIAVRRRLPLATKPLLVPLDGARARRLGTEDCKAPKDDLYNRVIPQLDPDIIITMNLGYERPDADPVPRPERHSPAERHTGSPTRGSSKTTTDSLARAARRAAARSCSSSPSPSTPNFNPLDCLSKANVPRAVPLRRRPAARSGSSGPTGRLAKQDDNVWSVDLDHLVCPFLPICDPIVNHQIVKMDPSHLTPRSRGRSRRRSTRCLKQNGIIAGTAK